MPSCPQSAFTLSNSIVNKCTSGSLVQYDSNNSKLELIKELLFIRDYVIYNCQKKAIN